MKKSLSLLVLAVMLGFWGCQASNAPIETRPSGALNSMQAGASGEWSHQPAFIQNAIAVQDRHTDELMALPGVIGTGTGVSDANTNEAVMMVYTDHEGVAGIPATIEGVPTKIRAIGTVKALSNTSIWGQEGSSTQDEVNSDAECAINYGQQGYNDISYTWPQRYPIYAGFSVGDNDQCASGSIGALVHLNGSGLGNGGSGTGGTAMTVYSPSWSGSSFSDGTEHFMLSCNHVFANENGAKGKDQMDQPGRVDLSCATTGSAGELYAWNYINSKHGTTNYYDAALAECNPSPYLTTGYHNGEQSHNWSPAMGDGTHNPSPQYTPGLDGTTTVSPVDASNIQVGLPVKKTGRTTGYTMGVVAAINVTIGVQYSHFTASFTHQIEVTGGCPNPSNGFIGSGDSGSLMVVDGDVTHNNISYYDNQPVGLNFAGGTSGGTVTSFANCVSYIATDFGITFDTSPF